MEILFMIRAYTIFAEAIEIRGRVILYSKPLDCWSSSPNLLLPKLLPKSVGEPNPLTNSYVLSRSLAARSKHPSFEWDIFDFNVSIFGLKISYFCDNFSDLSYLQFSDSLHFGPVHPRYRRGFVHLSSSVSSGDHQTSIQPCRGASRHSSTWQ